MVTATNPVAIHKLLTEASMEAELQSHSDSNQPASITIQTEAGGSDIVMSDCDDAIPDFCETIILSTGWDLDEPMTAEQVAKVNASFPYVSVYLDDEGDPYVHWAIVTGTEGIPGPVFLKALSRYIEVATGFAEYVGDPVAYFAEDTEE